MPSKPERGRFKTWLQNSTDLGPRTISDVLSRLDRVERLVQLRVNVPVEDFLFRLSKNSEFSKLTLTVKSQLKKSYKLYAEFCNDNKSK